jgi:hypothetical protein
VVQAGGNVGSAGRFGSPAPQPVPPVELLLLAAELLLAAALLAPELLLAAALLLPAAELLFAPELLLEEPLFTPELVLVALLLGPPPVLVPVGLAPPVELAAGDEFAPPAPLPLDPLLPPAALPSCDAACPQAASAGARAVVRTRNQGDGTLRMMLPLCSARRRGTPSSAYHHTPTPVRSRGKTTSIEVVEPFAPPRGLFASRRRSAELPRHAGRRLGASV